MATKWYKDYRFIVPIVVTLIGLAGKLAPDVIHSLASKGTMPLVVLTLDETTSQPLAGVHLQVAEQGLSEETDSQGRCTLGIRSDLKRVRIAASKEGFEPNWREVDVLPNMAPVSLGMRSRPAADGSPVAPTAASFSVIVVVIAEATEERLPEARVSSDEQGLVRETDSQGRCTLAVRSDLKKLRITVSKAGYRPENNEIDVFPGMDPVRVLLVRARKSP